MANKFGSMDPQGTLNARKVVQFIRDNEYDNSVRFQHGTLEILEWKPDPFAREITRFAHRHHVIVDFLLPQETSQAIKMRKWREDAI